MVELITKSAIRYEGEIYTGKRHNEIIALIIKEKGIVRVIGGEQGFITNSGRFVDRKEAGQIALRSKQINRIRYCYGLDSSDLNK